MAKSAMAVNHSLIIPVIEASNLSIFSLAVNQAFKLLLTHFSLDSLRKNPGKKRSFHSAEKEGHSPPYDVVIVLLVNLHAESNHSVLRRG